MTWATLQIDRRELADSAPWTPLGEWSASYPPEYTFYNEAIWCSHCGIVWARRRFIGVPIRGWWLTQRQCHQSPWTWYDFPAALAANNAELLDVLTTEFLSDPSIAGYTGQWTAPLIRSADEARIVPPAPHSRPSDPPDRLPGLGQD